MWQKFTETARKAVFFAQEEAVRFGWSNVSTDHLLLGLVREEESAAVQVLDRLKVARGRIRAGVERQVTRCPGHPRGQDMQLTPRVKEAIDLANEESLALGDAQIGTQHLLLGLLRQAEAHPRVEPGTESAGPATGPEPADRSGAVLLALGIDRQQAQAALADLPKES